MPVSPIPAGYPRVIPYLIVADVPRLIDFAARAFGATLARRHDLPSGDVMHAEIRIGESVVMMGGAGEGCPPIPAAIHLYVEDVDATWRAALEAGGTPLQPPTDKFYGDRNAGVADPTGNTWYISTRIEDVPDDELDRRAKAAGPA